jgi:hypothetical protein
VKRLKQAMLLPTIRGGNAMKIANIASVSATETFNVTGGALRVTDPCYDMDTWCAGTLDKVRNGTWETHVGYHRDALDMSSSAEYRARLQADVDRHEGTPLHIVYLNQLQRYDKETAEYLGRVAYIHIVAQGFERHFDHEAELDSTWKLADIHVGVDSGQAGFFDVVKYALSVADKNERGEGDSFESFYDSVCNLTLDAKSFGTVQFGCVSSSGYGDGGYNCYFRRNDLGEVIEALIVFLEDYHEDDEELAA